MPRTSAFLPAYIYEIGANHEFPCKEMKMTESQHSQIIHSFIIIYYIIFYESANKLIYKKTYNF